MNIDNHSDPKHFMSNVTRDSLPKQVFFYRTKFQMQEVLSVTRWQAKALIVGHQSGQDCISTAGTISVATWGELKLHLKGHGHSRIPSERSKWHEIHLKVPCEWRKPANGWLSLLLEMAIQRIPLVHKGTNTAGSPTQPGRFELLPSNKASSETWPCTEFTRWHLWTGKDWWQAKDIKDGM